MIWQLGKVKSKFGIKMCGTTSGLSLCICCLQLWACCSHFVSLQTSCAFVLKIQARMFMSLNRIDIISCCFCFMPSRHCTIASNCVSVVCSRFLDLTSSCLSTLLSLLTSSSRTNLSNSTYSSALVRVVVDFAHQQIHDEQWLSGQIYCS